MLDGFRQAVRLYLSGTSGSCPWEPNWQQLYPHIAPAGASEDVKDESARWLAGQGVTCSKLKLDPAACHGCDQNPLGTSEKKADSAMIAAYIGDIRLAEDLRTAARLNLLSMDDLTSEEFAMVSCYIAEVDAAARERQESNNA